MKMMINVVIERDDATRQTQTVYTLERTEPISPPTLGLSLTEGKAVAHAIQEILVSGQLSDYLEKQRPCEACGKFGTCQGK